MTRYYTNYYTAKADAERHHLKECVYGDWDDRVSYCGWNKTGRMDDDCEVECYYRFDGSKPERQPSEWLSDWLMAHIGVAASGRE